MTAFLQQAKLSFIMCWAGKYPKRSQNDFRKANETSADGTRLLSFNIPLIKSVILKWHAPTTCFAFHVAMKLRSCVPLKGSAS